MSIETEAESVHLESDVLVVCWRDEHVSRFRLVELRRKCPCAECHELRRRGQEPWPKPGAPAPLGLEGAELVGGWGLSLRWNDGHQTGIYGWETLRTWCPCKRCSGS